MKAEHGAWWGVPTTDGAHSPRRPIVSGHARTSNAAGTLGQTMRYYRVVKLEVIVPFFEINVQHRDGSAAVGARVVLSSTALLGGMSREVLTDSRGVAVVEMSSSGEASVIVNGARRQAVRPGRCVVTL